MIPGSAVFLDSDDTFAVQRSLFLYSPRPSFLSKILVGTATDPKKWTLSIWIKRNTSLANGVFSWIMQGVSPQITTAIWFNSSSQIVVYNEDSTATGSSFVSAATYGTGVWRHFVIAVDTTQATATNRVKLYVNGVLQAWGAAGSVGWSQNIDTALNTYSAYGYLGYDTKSGSSTLDAYVSEFYLIDSQTLTPSSFGKINPVTSSWSPNRYSGSYGTKSWYINFKDPTSTSTIALDYSGNNNGFVPYQVILPGDSRTDVPA